MEIDAFLGNRYKLESMQNFEEYMKAAEVNGMIRKVAGKLHPILELNKSGNGEYTLTSKLPFKSIEIKFKPGVEFDQETPDGRDVRSTITIKGTTLHEVQKEHNGKKSIFDRTFSDDEVKMVMKIDNVVATRIYKREKTLKV